MRKDKKMSKIVKGKNTAETLFNDSAFLEEDLTTYASNEEQVELDQLKESNALIQEITDFLRNQKLVKSQLWENVCLFFQGSQSNLTDIATTEPIREIMLFVLENEHFNRQVPEGNVFIEALEKLHSSFIKVSIEDDVKAINEICEKSIQEFNAGCSIKIEEMETQAQLHSNENEERYKKSLEDQKAIVNTISWKRFFYRALPAVLIPSTVAFFSKCNLGDINGLIEMSKNFFTGYGSTIETKKALVEVTQELSLSDIYQALLREFMAYFNLKKEEK